MRKSFVVWLGVAAVMFVVAPILVVRAPYESTMGLVQKIFYYHAPLGMMMFLSAFVSGIAAGIFIFNRRAAADRVSLAAAEITVLFGSLVLITGPMWARKAWGVWWQWDARLTSSLLLWMIFVAYALVRRYGGPGASRLSAGLAVFGMADVPLVYFAVNFWKTQHPTNNVIPTLGPGMREPFLLGIVCYLLLFIALLAARKAVRSGERRLHETHDLAADAGLVE